MLFGRDKIEYKSDNNIRSMRRAGLVVADILDALQSRIAVGMTTHDLDAIAAEVIADAGATSNFLGYYGYPATICVSVNDVVVHGIPGPQVLHSGDVVSMDVGAIVDGWHGDAAITVVLDPPRPEDVALSEATRSALWDGIARFATATRIGDIGETVEASIYRANPSYGVLREYVGHGIGTQMHQAPEVLNYASDRGSAKIKPGMCIAIEPMVTLSGIRTDVLDDGWTVKTVNGLRSVHWEHTVARHKGGIWVLTARDGGQAELAARGVSIAPLDPIS